MRRLLSILLVASALGLLARGAVPCDALRTQPACFVALHPGPTIDTLRSIEIDAPTYASTGELVLTTIQVYHDLDPYTWVRGAFDARVHQVPREVIYPPGTTVDEQRRRNILLMGRSQLDAAFAALRQAGYEIDMEPRGALVHGIIEGFPAHGVLDRGDVIVAIDSAPVTRASDASAVLRGRAPGDEVEVAFRRGQEDVAARITLAADPDDPARGIMGVFLRDHIQLPVDVRIEAGNIGGPSAGLMFALAIVDLLDPEDLTGGAVIAGTGTIDREGNVGPIGGIQQKVFASLERGSGQRPASVFLLPAGNLEEALRVNTDRDLLLVPVATLSAAVEALAELRAGRSPAEAYALGSR